VRATGHAPGEPAVGPTRDGRLDRLVVAVEELMRSRLVAPAPELDKLYGWLRYQSGWASIDGRPAQARTAKNWRPRVCLTSCEAVGGDPATAVRAAAAIELTHEFSLIHDDIEDGDRERRGRPALWTSIGIAQAINAGDALFGIARGTLTERSATTSADQLAAMVAGYDRACVELAEGQFLDLDFETRPSVGPEEYEAMVARKTGALLGAAAELGAIAGGATQPAGRAMGEYGRCLGLAFQIGDDCLGLWGDPARTGKPAGADLLRKKKSLPILLALADPSTGPSVRAFWQGSGADPGAGSQGGSPPERPGARDVLALLERHGIRQRAEAQGEMYADQALAALASLPLVAPASDELAELARLATRRLS